MRNIMLKERAAKSIVIVSIIILILLIAAFIINRSLNFQTATTPLDQKEALGSFDQLPFLKLDTMAGGASSYDRSGGNYDGFDKGNYLYEDDYGDKVMLDVQGPGTVYRMWFTGFDEINSYIKIYFDGEKAPSINMRLKELFTGENEPFLAPFVNHNFQSSGGFVSNVPLSFSDSIKITTNGVGEHNFYNIGYHTYTPDTEIMTWNEKDKHSEAKDVWEKVWTGELANVRKDQEIEKGIMSIDAHTSETIIELDGPRMIDWLTITIPGIEPGAEVEKLLQNVYVQAYWDEEEEPSVDAPIGSLFAMGQFEVYETRSMYAGMHDNNEMYLNIPMPFEKSAKIIFFNDTDKLIEDVDYKLAHRRFSDSFEDVGYFKTQFHHQVAKTMDGKDLLILEEEGAGHFIGVVQSIKVELNQGIADRWHLEGDERIYIDHSKSPAIHGTGTEDFYNGGWYFGYGLFSTPLAGYTSTKVEDNVESSSFHRFFMADAIPFRNHIHASIEHGATNDIDEEAWILAMYYHQPKSRMKLTDELDIGDTESENKHQYNIIDETWQGNGKYSYEGINDQETIEDFGRAHKGKSEFIMKINSENTGVILRRRFDQIVKNQRAAIYVDGEYVGDWYRAGDNIHHSWKDDDFMIPANFTEGKENIHIKVKYKDSAPDWSEFLYQVYSLL